MSQEREWLPLLHFEQENIWVCLCKKEGACQELVHIAKTIIPRTQENVSSFFPWLEEGEDKELFLETFRSAFSPRTGYWLRVFGDCIFFVSDKQRTKKVCEIVFSKPMEFQLGRRRDTKKWEFL
uniref:Uncharacterized protein n=1 Tax=Marseillevirus sp. TaxID=2809551 RepID=A0AA96IXP7_9VIRU|nr:hypothetical protein MarFTMF_387 [Marseillevirus sp.]